MNKPLDSIVNSNFYLTKLKNEFFFYFMAEDSKMNVVNLRKELLELLEKDLEFRYTVIAYLGLSEALKKLDALLSEQVKLREDFMRLIEEQAKLREEQAKLREDFKELREEQIKLREDFNKMLNRIGKIEVRLGRIETTLEKLTIDIEDEAKSFVKHKLKEMGLSLELTSLLLPNLEINIYGVSNDLCVIGEASVRAGAGLIDELLRKLSKLKKNYPDKLRKKVMLLIYTSLPTFELIEKAKEKNIWVLKATEDFYKPEKLFFEI